MDIGLGLDRCKMYRWDWDVFIVENISELYCVLLAYVNLVKSVKVYILLKYM